MAVDVLVRDLLAELDVYGEVVDLGAVLLAVEGVEAGGDVAVAADLGGRDGDLALEAILLVIDL